MGSLYGRCHFRSNALTTAVGTSRCLHWKTWQRWRKNGSNSSLEPNARSFSHGLGEQLDWSLTAAASTQALEVRLDDRSWASPCSESKKFGAMEWSHRTLVCHGDGEPSIRCLTVEHNGFLVESGLSKRCCWKYIGFDEIAVALDELFLTELCKMGSGLSGERPTRPTSRANQVREAILLC